MFRNVQSYLDIVYPEYRKKAPLPPDLLELCIEYLYFIDKKYYLNSKRLLCETPWVNERRHGIETRRDYNGILYYEIPWVNGNRHGIERIWDGRGELSFEVHWKDGKKHGIEKHWHKGKLYIYLPWIDGQMHGIEKIWRDNGTLYCKIVWINGVKVEEIEILE